MRRVLILSLVLMASAAAPVAWAQTGSPPTGAPPSGPPPRPLPGAKVDDGPISDGERVHMFISPAGEPFRGGDGLARWFARADADHDGRLTPTELQTDAERLFRQLDKNKDEKLDGFEASAYERDVAPEITGMFFSGEGSGVRMPDEPRRGGFFRRSGGAQAKREGAGRFGLLDTPQPVEIADRDLDGKITLREWRETQAIRFGLLDKDKAGVLTLDTLPPLPGAKPAKSPEKGAKRPPR